LRKKKRMLDLSEVGRKAALGVGGPAFR